MYLISACLLGDNCKYSGGNNYNEKVIAFSEKHSFMPVCPELTGGLKAPRPPVEIVNGRAVNSEGTDVTNEFNLGCQRTWEQAVKEAEQRGEKLEGAILKAKSPSCGAGKIYDGTFSHVVIDGDGFLTRYLKEKGLKVITEEDEIND